MIKAKYTYTLEGNNILWLARTLAKANCKIEAIKLVRQATGSSLRDAKDYVENGFRSLLEPGHVLRSTTSGLTYEILGRANINGVLNYWVRTKSPCGDVDHMDTYSAVDVHCTHPHWLG